MDHFQQQIERFWKNRMTDAEKQQFLADFLENEEAWKKVLESRYQESLEQEQEVMSEERAEAVLQRIHAQIAVPAAGKGTTVRWIRRMAVAAALIAGIVIMYDRLRPSRNIPPASTANALLLRTNTDSVPQTLLLSDSSVVTLAPGSAIRYYENFTATTRDISLSGEARFRVAKDEARPFTVYAGDVVTTALGTCFMINAPSGGAVTVKLFEGKVVVRPGGGKDTAKAVYLQPGEELHFSGRQLIKHARKKGEAPTPAPASSYNDALPEFVQEPLANVLSAVGKRYRVHFVYSEEAISSMHVTGKFLPSDALKDILSILGTVNGLSFQSRGDTITVSRSQ